MKRKLLILVSVLLSVFIGGSAFAIELSDMRGVEIHGFVSQGYMKSDDNNFFADTEGNGTFQFNEIGINFSSEVSDRLRVGVQLFGRDLGRMGNKDVGIDWAFADYNMTDWLNLKAGKFKIENGLYNSSRDVDMLRTSIFLPQSVYNEAWRDSANAISGFALYGYVPAAFAGAFTYNLQLGSTDFGTDGGEARLLEGQYSRAIPAFDIVSADVDRTNAAQVMWETPLEGLKIGATVLENVFTTGASLVTVGGSTGPGGSIVSADVETDLNVNQLAATYSLEYAVGNLIFAAEYTLTDFELELEKSAVSAATVTKFESEGYYGSLSYRFTDWLELGTYYSVYYPDKDDKDGDDAVASGKVSADEKQTRWLKDTAVTARFDITENWIFKLEAHKMDGAAIMFSDENLDGFEENWYLYAAKMTFSF